MKPERIQSVLSNPSAFGPDDQRTARLLASDFVAGVVSSLNSIVAKTEEYREVINILQNPYGQTDERLESARAVAARLIADYLAEDMRARSSVGIEEEGETDAEASRRFEVHLTRRNYDPRRLDVKSYSVRISYEWGGRERSAADLANSLLGAVLKKIAPAQLVLPLLSVERPQWHLSLAKAGAVDEFTLGVQATYVDPDGQIVAMLALSFPEYDAD